MDGRPKSRGSTASSSKRRTPKRRLPDVERIGTPTVASKARAAATAEENVVTAPGAEPMAKDYWNKNFFPQRFPPTRVAESATTGYVLPTTLRAPVTTFSFGERFTPVKSETPGPGQYEIEAKPSSKEEDSDDSDVVRRRLLRETQKRRAKRIAQLRAKNESPGPGSYNISYAGVESNLPGVTIHPLPEEEEEKDALYLPKRDDKSGLGPGHYNWHLYGGRDESLYENRGKDKSVQYGIVSRKILKEPVRSPGPAGYLPTEWSRGSRGKGPREPTEEDETAAAERQRRREHAARRAPPRHGKKEDDKPKPLNASPAFTIAPRIFPPSPNKGANSPGPVYQVGTTIGVHPETGASIHLPHRATYETDSPGPAAYDLMPPIVDDRELVSQEEKQRKRRALLRSRESMISDRERASRAAGVVSPVMDYQERRKRRLMRSSSSNNVRSPTPEASPPRRRKKKEGTPSGENVSPLGQKEVVKSQLPGASFTFRHGDDDYSSDDDEATHAIKSEKKRRKLTPGPGQYQIKRHMDKYVPDAIERKIQAKFKKKRVVKGASFKSRYSAEPSEKTQTMLGPGAGAYALSSTFRVGNAVRMVPDVPETDQMRRHIRDDEYKATRRATPKPYAPKQDPPKVFSSFGSAPSSKFASPSDTRKREEYFKAIAAARSAQADAAEQQRLILAFSEA